MAKTHELFQTPLFFQTLQVAKGTPVVHRAIQSQEIDEPFRLAKPWVIRLPFWFHLGFYSTLGDKSYRTMAFSFTFRQALVVGFWRETGYEEHEALSHALNLDEEHARDQATDFETSAEGLDNTSTERGKSACEFTVRGTDVP